jgi:hypothetical protein
MQWLRFLFLILKLESKGVDEQAWQTMELEGDMA